MANLNYCRFENLCNDFSGVLEVLEEGLDNLSPSERKYSEMLYERAKSYVGMYEMLLQEPKNDDEDDEEVHNWFCSYMRVQLEGNYNMIMEAREACEACGIPFIDIYKYIQQNYETIRRVYSKDYDRINKEIMEELKNHEIK